MGGIVEIDDLYLRPTNGSIVSPMLHCHAIYEHPVKGAVAGFKGRAFGARELAEGVVQRRRGQAGVQLGEGVLHPTLQRHLPIVGALGVGHARRDVRTVRHLPAQGGKPVKGSLFNVGFGDAGHFVQSTTPAIARMIITAKTTCSTANRMGIHRSMVVTARYVLPCPSSARRHSCLYISVGRCCSSS